MAWIAGWPLCPQSPGSRPGLLCGRGSGGGVARASSPASQASERRGSQSCAAIEAPSASWGTATYRTNWQEQGSSGVVYLGRHTWWALDGMDSGLAFVPAVPGLAPRGFYGSGEGVARAISPASQASERQDAEASLRGVSAGQDARSERPARWHGQPRPTEDVASCQLAGLASERRAGCP